MKLVYWKEKIPFWENVFDGEKHWYVQYLSHHFVIEEKPNVVAIQKWCSENIGNIRHWHYSPWMPTPEAYARSMVAGDVNSVTHVPVLSFAFEADAIRFKIKFHG